MAPQAIQKRPRKPIPKLDVVIETGGGDEEPAGGETDVRYGFCVAEKAREGFLRRGVGGGGGEERVPEIDCEVITCGDETFCDLACLGCGSLVAGFCF